MTIPSADFVKSLIDRIIHAARNAGADEAAVLTYGGTYGLTRFAHNQIIQNLEQKSITISLAVSVGKREAVVSMDYSDNNEINRFAEMAVDLARLHPENPEHSAPVKAGEIYRPDGFDLETASMTYHEKAVCVRDICNTIKNQNLLSFGTLTSDQIVSAIGNSEGTFAYYPQTSVTFTITVRTQNASGSSRQLANSHQFKNIDFDGVVNQSVTWAERSQNPQPIKPGDYTVILTSTAAMQYLMFLFLTLDSKKVEENRSPLNHYFKTSNPLNCQVFSPQISLRSRINYPGHPTIHFGSTISMEGVSGQSMTDNLFSMGLPMQEFPIVEKGKIKHLFSSLYWARKKNEEPVAFPSLIEFEGTQMTLEDLISRTEHALLINSLWYIRFVDHSQLLITGLTRDGNFLVQDGKVVKSIRNLRFNESPLISLNQIEAIGLPEKKQGWLSNVIIPPMVIRDMTFTAETDAV